MSDVSRTVRLPPDPGLVTSLGARQTLHSALADIVDNSVDAGARGVRIILETDAGKLQRVLVVDDGEGMDEQSIDRAMTLGHQREYRENDLGHFGLGLKASSFGSADTLTVWSTRENYPPVGRRIRRTDFSHDFTCEILEPEAAVAADHRRRREFEAPSGTVVEWSDLRAAYGGANADEAAAWIQERESEVRSHLGLTFHRLLKREALRLDIRIDEAGGGHGVAVPVKPLDPFGYRAAGKIGYPKKLTAEYGGRTLSLIVHIWPAKSSAVEYRLSGTGVDRQGLYVYRNDRLLQAGGWADTAVEDPKRRLARVVLDADPVADGITLNADKHGVRLHPDLSSAILQAKAPDGTDFQSYLQDAENVQVLSAKRSRDRKAAVMPDKGFAPALRRVITDELPSRQQPPMSIRWTRMRGDDFFEVDLPRMTLNLNERYRTLFVSGRASLNDAPFLKAVLYLLNHHLFEGERLGSKDKDDIALFNAVLVQAARLEEKPFDGRE